MNSTSSNRLLRLDRSVFDQFAPASDHAETVKSASRHIETHLGPVEQILREKAREDLSIDIHVVSPSPQRDYYTLITSGMSDLPMTTPINLHQYRFGELYMHLPATWNPDITRWPIDLLLALARRPHQQHSWLGYGHCITGDNQSPLSCNTDFTGVLLTSSLMRHEQFQALQSSPNKRIYFYNVCPLYANELQLCQQAGPTYMEDLLIANNLTGPVDTHRMNLVTGDQAVPENK